MRARGAPETIQATATFKPTGVDAQVATIFGYAGGRVATSLSASDTKGPNTASVIGTEARIDIDAVWWLSRPLAVIGPLVCTAPMIWVYLRFHRKGRPLPVPDDGVTSDRRDVDG